MLCFGKYKMAFHSLDTNQDVWKYLSSAIFQVFATAQNFEEAASDRIDKSNTEYSSVWALITEGKLPKRAGIPCLAVIHFKHRCRGHRIRRRWFMRSQYLSIRALTTFTDLKLSNRPLILLIKKWFVPQTYRALKVRGVP